MLSLFTMCIQKCDLESQSSILDDDLLIDVPGSSYSRPNVDKSNEQNQQPDVFSLSPSEHICCGSADAQRVVDHEKSCQEREKPDDPVEFDTAVKNQESRELKRVEKNE